MKTQTTRLAIKGMGCASCVAKIERKLQAVDGIISAHVNLADRTANVKTNVGILDSQLIQTIAEAGSYQASIIRDSSDEKHKAEAEQQQLQHSIRQSVVALTAGAAFMLSSMLGLLPSLSSQFLWLIIGSATALLMAYSGAHFFTGAWNSLKHHNTSMDTLVAMGTGVAWLFSILVIIAPDLWPKNSQHIYFETALIVIALVNIGHVLEARARSKTNQAIEKLLSLQVQTARVVRQQQELDIPIENLILGEIIRLRPGEKVPADGVIHEGTAFIDESMLTGEAMPISKKVGDKVFTGTINNNSSFLYTATHMGSDTVLAHIIETVRQAQSSKPHLAKLVDKIAAIFVPIVLSIALCTALFWWLATDYGTTLALVTSMSVLLIACPCALGLATPISIIVGMGKAAEYGILIRNAEALERAAQLTTIIFDKTGTITEGKPTLRTIITAPGILDNDALALAAAVETGSEHPLAKAILEASAHYKLPTLSATCFHATSGYGVKAVVKDQDIILGNHDFLTQHQINTSFYWLKQSDRMAKQASTPIFLAKNRQIIALLAIRDPIKSDASTTISQLRSLGIKIIMLTGDNQHTARAIANEVGIDHIAAELKPHEKDAYIAKLQDKGEIVGMVGDGINDAAALARAHVGFAIASGSDITIESADIVLMRSSLAVIPTCISISAATLRNIKQNLLGAFLYNSLAIPIAAGMLFTSFGVLLNPMLAGAAMALSSLTVVSNANRLRFFKP